MPPITTTPFGEETIANPDSCTGSLGPKREEASKFLKRMNYQTLKKVLLVMSQVYKMMDGVANVGFWI